MALSETEKLKRINAALMEQVERSMDQQGNAFSLFQTAIGLEKQVRQRTDELALALRRIEYSNQALNAAKEVAERANISKTRFLAAASHDILQPLNAAGLSLSTLTELQTTPEGKSLAAQVEKSLASMDELIRTLLDISKLDSGIIKPDIRAVSIGRLLDGLRADFVPIAAERGLRIRFKHSNQFVTSDRTMLRRILQNLISNAINYTPAGGVLVGTRLRGDRLRIDIVDSGIGIPEDCIDTVFEEFFRGDGSSTADHANRGGLGLGLSIVQRMVSTLDHDLSVKSVQGRGTRFILQVPVSAPQAASQSREDGATLKLRAFSLSGARVLLIENDPAVVEAMVSLLELWLCSVRIAYRRNDVSEVLNRGDWQPDIILADQQLDNNELGTRIVGEVRQQICADLPAVIITANADDAFADTVQALNMELLHKPIKPAELHAVISNLLSCNAAKRCEQ